MGSSFALPAYAVDNFAIEIGGTQVPLTLVLVHRNPYQIVIDRNSVWDDNACFLYHEWSHCMQFRTLGDKVPINHGFALHAGSEISPVGFAFAEGFADYQSGAIFRSSTGHFSEWEAENELENFRHNTSYGLLPWYRGDASIPNSRGDSVENAVCQFFWDLFDSASTPGGNPPRQFDDEGVCSGWQQLMDVQSDMGQAMSYSCPEWSHRRMPMGDDSAGIYMLLNQWRFQDSHDYTGWIRDHWSSDISELYNVVIHPF
jgi:hypothetical protein